VKTVCAFAEAARSNPNSNAVVCLNRRERRDLEFRGVAGKPPSGRTIVFWNCGDEAEANLRVAVGAERYNCNTLAVDVTTKPAITLVPPFFPWRSRAVDDKYLAGTI
jgi:hypothetical protein